MPEDALTEAVKWLDGRIAEEVRERPQTIAHLTERQRELGLLDDERTTSPFLRPHIIAHSHYAAVVRAAKTLSAAFERMTAAALNDAGLMAALGLTEAEERMVRIEPGYHGLCVTSRLDAFMTGDDFRFLEYNAESPAGLAVQRQVEEMLFQFPYMREFLERYTHWLPRPHRALLDALVETYRRWGGAETHPHIAIVDWEGVATASEFQVLKEFFEAEGYKTIIAAPRDLEFDGDRLSVDGFRIDIFYKRVIIHEFLSRTDEMHPLTRAYAAGKVCMANSFRSKIAHKKSGFAILSDPLYAHLFTPEQQECIRRHIPWTRRVARGETTYDGETFETVELLRSEREHLVLKPNDDYGGKGVFLGWEMLAAEWEEAISTALSNDYVVQERAPVTMLHMPLAVEGEFATALMHVDFDPFLFFDEVEGGLVRMSASALINVSSGGGETALLTLTDL